jgi:CBS domain-containing protein
MNRPSEGRVREWMSTAPVTAPRDLPAGDAARLMLNGGFHHLPVTKDERPVGVVGLRSVVSALRRGFPGW